MICPRCKSEVRDGDRFCNNCGQSMEIAAPAPSQPVYNNVQPQNGYYNNQQGGYNGQPQNGYYNNQQGYYNGQPQNGYYNNQQGYYNGQPQNGYYNNQPGGYYNQGVKKPSSMALAARVLMILSTVYLAFTIIGLAWSLPMTIVYSNSLKNGQPVSTTFKVCTLLFVNTIAGILMLCDKDQ